MMDLIKCGKLVFILFFSTYSAKAQDTLKLSREQCEAVFLTENLALIAEKLEVPKAEALVLQAKLWPNPTFTFDEVNFWATTRQTGGQEVSPPIFGDFGRNQQFAVGIEQLILTAGKRKKFIALEQVGVEKAQQYFEDLLRNLKIEFRNHLTNLQYLQFSRNVYQSQINSVKQLTQAYQKQVEEGNIPKGEYIRLKALELEFSKNINELNKEINDAQKELKLLMRLPANTQLILADDDYLRNTEPLKQLTLTALLDTAKTARADLQIAQLEQSYFSNLYAYEKAQRVPDLTLLGSYDRNGGTMLDFVGFGVAMDLPVFNRNQGNIKHARIGIEQSKILYDQKALSVENEIVLAYQNLVSSIQFFESIEADYEKTLDELLDAYTKNFTNRSISLLEYLDFIDAYLENKKIILEAGKDVNEKAEELNYSMGKDVVG